MASSVIKGQPSVRVNVTTGSNLQIATINAVRYGKVLVVSYYFIPSANISRNDVLATFDIPTGFITNMFDGQSCNLAGRSKNLLADKGLTAGTAYMGQVVGIIE